MSRLRATLSTIFARMIEARTREAARRVAMQTAAFTADDIWHDLKSGQVKTNGVKPVHGLSRLSMRAGA